MLNRCIGCYHYDSKENLCIHGSPIFIDDVCTDYQDSEFVIQIRADAIDEFVEVLKKHIDECGTKSFTDGMQMAIFSKHYIDAIAEQLKEWKNER